jgi:hypothetical protein
VGGIAEMDLRVEKAWFKNLDTGEEIRLPFNPTEYSIKKTVNWTEAKNTNENTGRIEFNGGNPIEISMKLFFDTSLEGKNVQTEYTNKLWKLTMISDSSKPKPSPPDVEFHWGQRYSFVAVVTSISEQLTLFLPTGIPVRSTVDITIKQAKAENKFPFQNPTSGGFPGYKSHLVRPGDTLDNIAAAEYGDARYWRWLAEVNNLDDPARLRVGTRLQLPKLPENV